MITPTKGVGLYAWVFLLMARPLQLVAITLVYGLGTAIARANGAQVEPTAFWFGLLVIIPISISIHYANEYADYETDALTRRTPFSGSSGALPESSLPRRIALIGAWASLIIGSLMAISGWYTGMLNRAALTVLSLGTFFGWMYSLFPLALAWRGWGEVTNAALGGIALPTYAYAAQTGHVDGLILLSSLPFGLMVFINLLATTWPDRMADAAVGKHTLATRWPKGPLRLTYIAAATSAFIAMILMGSYVFPTLVVWTSLLALPFAFWGARAYTRQHSPFPTVAAMTVLLIAQLIAWLIVI